MSRIFMAYSRDDEQFVRQLVTDLTKLGADIWIDFENIPAGVKWSSAIQEGLQISDIMIVVISPDSMASHNVEAEWGYFFDKRKTILPVLYRPAEIHFQLQRIQFVDFHEEDYTNALRKLYTRLEALNITLNPFFDDTQANTTVKIDEEERKRMYSSFTGNTGLLDPNKVVRRQTGELYPIKIKETEDMQRYFDEKSLLRLYFYNQSTPLEIRVPRGQLVVIGRNTPDQPIKPDVDLEPYGAEEFGMSRRHAALALKGTSLLVQDLDSTNFTFINDSRLTRHETRALKDGDIIRFGGLTARINFVHPKN